jgi:hypothetical protein
MMAKVGAESLTFWFASATLAAEATEKPLFSIAFASLFRNGSSSSTISKDLFVYWSRLALGAKILFIEDRI